jgi:UDP-2-acetamido-2-deoxy-ribo-hexuluronate aminotransferase
MKKIKFFDLKILDQKYKKKLLQSFKKFLEKGNFFLGPEVEIIEKKIAIKNQSRYCVFLSSGSSALYLALKALGIKDGDEVITTPLSWIMTSNAIRACGAIPVFVDVDFDFNIDAKLIEKKITTKTKAIVPVHYAGLMCDMNIIKKISNKYNLKIVEDSAQAFGAKFKGKKSGNFSDIGAFSTNPMKPLAGFGESGFVVTKSKKYYNKILRLRHAGVSLDKNKKNTNLCHEISLNHKIDNLNATLLIESLKEFPKKIKKIKKLADFYEKFLTNKIKIQKTPLNKHHARYVFPIIAPKRDQLMSFLKKNGIETKIFNIPLIPKAPAYKNDYKNNKFAIAEELAKKILVLPCHEKLNFENIKYITKCINKFYNDN